MSLPLLIAAALAAGAVAGPHAELLPVADAVEHLAAPIAGAYWTPERMERAIPIDLPGAGETADRVRSLAATVLPPAAARRLPLARERRAAVRSTTSGSVWEAGGLVRKTTGRVFLTMNGVDFACSASAVRSANRSVVVTAGHCVKNGTGAWAENWVFVPGYQPGRRPYGTYTARRMFVPRQWARDGNDDYDVGMVVVNDGPGGRRLGDVAGGQEIGFNARRGQQTYGFGFPADPPYSGERLLYCAGVPHDDPHGQTRGQGLRCELTAGASGGPWLTSFDPATGRGVLTSVSSFKYSTDHRTMYGPYFGPAIKNLFLKAERA